MNDDALAFNTQILSILFSFIEISISFFFRLKYTVKERKKKWKVEQFFHETVLLSLTWWYAFFHQKLNNSEMLNEMHLVEELVIDFMLKRAFIEFLFLSPLWNVDFSISSLLNRIDNIMMILAIEETQHWTVCSLLNCVFFFSF